MNKIAFLFLLIAGCFTGCMEGGSSKYETGKDWPVYGGNKAGNRYSPLDQINIENVKDLQLAWTYDARDPQDSSDTTPRRPQEIQTQPIVIDGILYGVTAELRLFAVNAVTGEEIWKFSPPEKGNRNRGIMYWEKGDDKRIFYTVEANLYGLNAKTGELIQGFGNKGIVDLREGLSTGIDKDMTKSRLRATSPGVIYKNTLIIGSAVSEAGDALPGHIRAFDVVSGKLKWVFNTIPQPGEVGYDTWPKDAYKRSGGANSWSGIVLDDKKGVVFFGTGSPSGDFYGGNRPGANLFANCIVALDAENGSLKWYFQNVSHDLWDRDIPTPPNFTTIELDGKKLDVVVQATKEGFIYVLNSNTGESIFPIEERAVPTNGLPGETVFPTQKFPTIPAPFSRQIYTENDISDISPEAYAATKEIYERYRTDNMYAPPSVEGTLLFGYSGGAEWGGNAIDPEGILYQPANDNPWILEMKKNPRVFGEEGNLSGNALFAQNCAVCHGADQKGNGSDFPDISNLKGRMDRKQLGTIISTGLGRMPAFQQINSRDREAIIDFLLDQKTVQSTVAKDEHNQPIVPIKADTNLFGFQADYIAKAWTKVFDPNGYPGIKPPWGTLNAINLSTGKYLWRVPLGEFPELTAKGIPQTGTESYGGPIVTAGGLVFIAATRDEKIRAFDKKTGKVVWEYQLPAGGFATPVTYEVNGKQYVAIAVGGARGLKAGGYYLSFALPN